MVRIVVGKNGKSTVKNIAEQMQSDSKIEARYTLKGGTKVWRPDFVKTQRGYTPQHFAGVQINWALQGAANADVIYNEKGIFKASSKADARKIMYDAGVMVPNTTTSVVIANRWVRNGLTVISRPLTHRGGADFVVLDNSDDTEFHNGDFYYQMFFRKTREFRVHCACGKVLVMQEKLPVDGRVVDFDVPSAWNHSSGDFVFETVKWSDYSVDVCVEALKATEALGLDISAVDVMVSDDGEAVVTEVNTSPSLAEYSTQRYAKLFDLFDRRGTNKVEHWSWKEFTEGKEFAWKNKELNNA